MPTGLDILLEVHTSLSYRRAMDDSFSEQDRLNLQAIDDYLEENYPVDEGLSDDTLKAIATVIDSGQHKC